jgi:hypothetical protein
MPHWIKYVLLTLVLLLVGSIPLAMQFETGSINGLVVDDRGPIEGAFIEVDNSLTGSVTRAESDRRGRYEILHLRAGRYSMWVEADWHDPIWVSQILVEHGASTEKNLSMTPNPIETTIRGLH